MSIVKEYILKKMIIDLTDNGLYRWNKIKAETGLDEKRCKEMEKIISEVYEEFKK